MTTIQLPSEIQRFKAIVKNSLVVHTRYVHNYLMRDHHLLWAKYLEDTSIKRLIIVAPPKYGKSPVIGLDYLGWRIGNNPDNYHAIYISNTSRQSTLNSVALRDTIALNPRYNFVYDLKPDYVKGWAESEWFVKRKDVGDKDPTLQACGVHGNILGATVQEVILDDIADEENMSTAYQRQKLMDWLEKVPLSRLLPGEDNRVVMICTRWHEEDPAAEFEKRGWTVVQMPAIKDGKPTYPQLWSMPALDKAKVDMGTKNFELVFQQNVIREGGNIFHREWWNRWVNGRAPWQIPGEANMPIRSIVQSWDTAHKEKKENDYSACETWAVCDCGYYLLHAWRDKLDFPKLNVVARQLADYFKPHYILIEDAASGIDLISELKAKTKLPIIAIPVSSDKIARAHGATPTIETGNVFIPSEASWLDDWLYEHEIFPSGKNDDWVDTTTQFINWVKIHMVSGTTRASGVEQESRWREE